MYKKHAACLGLLVGLLLPVSLLANQQATQDALREAFSGHATACTAALPAVALQAPGLLHEFYAQRQFVPLWQDAGRRLDLLHELQQLADDGLDLAPYQLSLLQAQLQRQADSQAEACAELLASHSYLLALQHLYQGRLPLEQRESLWRADSLPASTRPSLLSIAWQGLDKVANAFAAARPSQPHYLQLRRAYASLRQQSPAEWPLIEAGRLLKPGMHDPRTPILIQRLQADGYLPADTPSATLYSESVASAVRQFQQLHGLQDDAIIGADTLAALNQPFAARLEQLRANLERWRWLSAEMEPDLLLVDIAGGLLSYYQGGQLQWQGRTQVGRAVRQTPQLKSRVNRLTLNPTWTVPPTILREDKLPEIRRDIEFLARNDLQVLDQQGNLLEPYFIDWQRPGPIILRQAAGPRNPLGKLAIRFPNPFSVYLHDTPSQRLFEKSPRAFSSGCVRVEGILQLLPLLLDEAERAPLAARLDSGKTSQYNLRQPVTILMAYWTAAVDEQGRLILRKDIYARDAQLSARLRQAH